MNKSKIALAATGGMTLIASLAAGFFLLKAFNAKTAALEGDMEEGIDGLGTVMQKATSLSRKPVYPCEKSVKEYEAKRDKFNEWRADALTIASRGDRNFTKTTSAAFKEFIFEESKRLVSLPGSVNGSLMKPDFPFGPFREFILDGKLPPESKLGVLQRQWDDITFLIEILAKAGVLEITGIESKAAAKPVSETANASQMTRKRSAKRPRAATKKQQADESAETEVSVERYAVTFLAKPQAFVRVLDELNVCERFVTVDSFSFLKSSDYLLDAITFTKKDEAGAASKRSSRRSSRRRSNKEEEEKPSSLSPREQALKMGVVSDPAYEAPLTVSIAVTISDFGSLSANKQDGEKEERK